MDIEETYLPLYYLPALCYTISVRYRKKIAEDSISAAVDHDKVSQPIPQGSRYAQANNDEAGGKHIRQIFMKYFE